MNLKRTENIAPLKYHSQQLLKKMLSPLCGLSQEIGYVARTHGDMRLMVGSAALTGVHVLFDRPNPGRGAYHIGGTGIFPEESMIRILGETVERYAQLMSDFSVGQLPFCSHQNLNQSEQAALPISKLCLHSEKQLERKGFPFQKLSNHMPLSWLKMQACNERRSMLVPAQSVLVGYNVRRQDGEPWFTSAVTTGTAAHITYSLAFKSALLELIQLDSVMGHWYGSWGAYAIQLDSRVSALQTLMKRYACGSQHRYQFYYIPNPDLIGFTIACVYMQGKGVPRVVIGLGAELCLEKAMYKAFLETVASVGLGRMVVFKGSNAMENHAEPLDPNSLYDLDRNVEYYAASHNFSRIEERFLRMPSIGAADLPADRAGSDVTQLKQLVECFTNSGKALYHIDLTGIESKNFGFKVVRVWSPDTLSLSLPSAPPVLHPRFNAFGGIQHEEPHPYP